MPLPVVVAEGRIALAAERITTPVISDSHVASTIIGGVPCPVDREVSVSVDRNIVTNAKVIRVADTINVRVLCAVHRGVSFTIRLEISGLINRDVSIAIHRKISLPSFSCRRWRRPNSRSFHRNVTLRTRRL
jgi:hypothetical protein